MDFQFKDKYAPEDLLKIMEILCDKDIGCEWDRVQNHKSIRQNFIEETYEAVDAIEANDVAHLCEELGDVLEQVLLHAQIAADAGEFTIEDVAHGLNEKLVRRHPHVFGDLAAASDGQAPAGYEQAHDGNRVLDIWDDVKRLEREARGQLSDVEPGLLDSVPQSLPALMQAQKISKKAAACGFDWDTTADVWDKVDEERREFSAEERGSAAALDEFGDVLFSAVNVARKEGIDAESALRHSCEKFRVRWAAMEAAAASRGQSLEDLSHEELEELWAQAKREG